MTTWQESEYALSLFGVDHDEESGVRYLTSKQVDFLKEEFDQWRCATGHAASSSSSVVAAAASTVLAELPKDPEEWFSVSRRDLQQGSFLKWLFMERGYSDRWDSSDRFQRNVQPSFKPQLRHDGLLDPHEIYSFLQRYEHWCPDRVSVCNPSVFKREVLRERLLRYLRTPVQRRAKFAVFPVLVHSSEEIRASSRDVSGHWVSVLVYYREAESGGAVPGGRAGWFVEFYNSCGQRAYQSGQLVKNFLQMVIRTTLLFIRSAAVPGNALPTPPSLRLVDVLQGKKRHQTGSSLCGMFVLTHIFARTFQDVSVQNFANSNLDDATVAKNRHAFFDFRARKTGRQN